MQSSSAEKIENREWRIEFLATGSELLDGSIYDRHTKYLAGQLRPLGFKIARTNIVSDDVNEIHEALVEVTKRSDIVLVSGGLGPTTDDRTLEVAAKCFGSGLVESPRARQNVLRMVKRHKRRKLNDGHRKMFLVPKGSQVIANLAGAAPAVQWDIGDRHLFFLPGPPHEFSNVIEHQFLPWLSKHSPKKSEQLLIFKVFGWAESDLSILMSKIKLPAEVSDVGFRTTLPENHIKIFVQASSRAESLRILKTPIAQIRKQLGSALFTEDSTESFEASVVRRLIKTKKKIALAESCTGGLVSSMITAVPGSSKTFERGFVTYSNEAKMESLGVSAFSLKKHGAVSEQVAKEMAMGALKNSNANIAISITGIAGPTGGTKSKPVGTVWLGRAEKKSGKTNIETKLLRLNYDRHLNQRFTAYVAMDWLVNS